MNPALIAAFALAAPAEPPPFFNGKDLSGWVNVNCAPGTFYVKDNQIITTGKPTGYLRTAKHYENFVLEFEWKHTREKGIANSGLFVWGDCLPAVGVGYTRGIEVQVLCGFEDDFAKKNPGKKSWASDHGDIFSIWGAKCVPDRPHPDKIERCNPSENRSKGAGQWNHYKITGNDGTIKLEVNGKEVSGVSKCSPRKGYLALESEGSECLFRNFKMTELPSTNPKPEEVCTLDEGFASIFDGISLEGWTANQWSVGDGTLTAKATDALSRKLGAGEVQLDVRLPAKASGTSKINGKVLEGKPGSWQRLKVAVDGEIRIEPEAGLTLRSLFFKPAK